MPSTPKSLEQSTIRKHDEISKSITVFLQKSMKNSKQQHTDIQTRSVALPEFFGRVNKNIAIINSKYRDN